MRVYILFLMCVSLFVGSCTKDYFVSESNVRLYVPQLKSGEIQSLTMVFHGENGELLQRNIIATNDVQLSKGIIKVSVPVNKSTGSNVVITCISDTESDRIIGNAEFNTSKILSLGDKSNPNRFFPTDDYRFFRHKMTIFPIGVESGIDTLDITEEYLNKGKINILFKSLPSGATQARIQFYKLGTSLDFYGKYNYKDLQYKEVQTTFASNSDSHSISNLLYPSKDEFVAKASAEDGGNAEENTSLHYLDMYIEFLNSNGDVIKSYRLSSDENPPTVTNSDTNEILPANKAILKSQGELNFVFDGANLIKFEIIGWGDANEEDTTPM